MHACLKLVLLEAYLGFPDIVIGLPSEKVDFLQQLLFMMLQLTHVDALMITGV